MKPPNVFKDSGIDKVELKNKLILMGCRGKPLTSARMDQLDQLFNLIETAPDEELKNLDCIASELQTLSYENCRLVVKTLREFYSSDRPKYPI